MMERMRAGELYDPMAPELVGERVFFNLGGGGALLLAGVNVGSRAIIGAGNPCRVIKEI